MVNFHFDEIQKENISKYKYSSVGNSISTKYMMPYWEYFQTFFPSYVAPNVISLIGLLFTIYAWYLPHQFYIMSPLFSEIASIVCILVSINLDSIDGIHARKTKNSSPIGELINHGCGSISTIFLCLALCNILEITNLISVWHLVGIFSLIFQYIHLNSLINEYLTFGKYLGPVEILIYFCIFVLFKLFDFKFVDIIATFLDQYSFSLYHCILMFNIFYANIYIRTTYKYSANGITVIYALQFFKSCIITYFNLNVNVFTIITDMMMLSILTFDVMVSKMAKKDLGPWFVVIAGISLLDKLTALFLSIAYMVSVIYEISTYMNIPVLTTNINVYVCGVYDLMHDGHYLSMKNALKFGNKLFAGVHGDEVCTNYKRQPVNSHMERCKNVENCKYVSVVIPNAPLYITEKELIDNNIHFVVCADTYFNDPNDKYYDVPRKMGILRMVPYSHGISTSDLIKRIVERFQSRTHGNTLEKSPDVNSLELTSNAAKIGKSIETYIDNNIATMIDNDLQNKIYDKDIECEILDDPAFSY